jgi:mannose-6-phosphate isomerase-like protein (cupin superfamily)
VQATPDILRISDNDDLLCIVIRASFTPDKTTFITDNSFNQQVGFVVYPTGGEIVRHIHKPIERHITGTAEVLVVRQGRCIMDIYNNDHALIASHELCTGDVMLMVNGGHGFRILEDTTLVEVKQGPYFGVDEKVRF